MFERELHGHHTIVAVCWRAAGGAGRGGTGRGGMGALNTALAMFTRSASSPFGGREAAVARLISFPVKTAFGATAATAAARAVARANGLALNNRRHIIHAFKTVGSAGNQTRTLSLLQLIFSARQIYGVLIRRARPLLIGPATTGPRVPVAISETGGSFPATNGYCFDFNFYACPPSPLSGYSAAIRVARSIAFPDVWCTYVYYVHDRARIACAKRTERRRVVSRDEIFSIKRDIRVVFTRYEIEILVFR